jgi:hypothetical protein
MGNEREISKRDYRHRVRQIRTFERAILYAEQRGSPGGIHPEVHKAMIAAMCSEVDVLRESLRRNKE